VYAGWLLLLTPRHRLQKSEHLKRMERECAKLARRAEERLKVSEAIRSGQLGATAGPPSSKDAVIVARERGRIKVGRSSWGKGAWWWAKHMPRALKCHNAAAGKALGICSCHFQGCPNGAPSDHLALSRS
jgi:hypothetical protein